MTIINTSKDVILTKMEKELIHLISYDYLDEEIARELPIPIDDIKQHRESILKKLEADTMPAAIRVAFETKILQLYDSAYELRK